MKLYLLTQDENNNYDTYDACIVCAKDEEEARQIHPRTIYDYEKGEPHDEAYNKYAWEESAKSVIASWCSSPEKVKCKYLGTAAPGTKKGIILGSFRAG